ncbi:MAG: purple acid phosphatase family protein [Dissulfurispiraceae bacterium]
MNTMMKGALTSVVLALALVVCSTAAFAGILKRPYMIYPGNNTTMEVLWQDTATETTNTISWGTDTTYSLGSATVAENNSTANQHIYTITGLTPGTLYYYQVADATNGVYGSGSFLTAPAAGATSVQFIGLGDTRTQPNALDMVQAEVNKFIAANPSYQGLAIHDGDWVASDTETDWTNEWFSPNMADSIKFLSQVPVNGAKGNHEDQSGYSQYFPKYYPFPWQYVAPKTSGSLLLNNFFWSFDYGPVHFTIVDQYSEQQTVNGQSGTSGPSLNSTQYNWLVNDLSAADANPATPWKILIYHEPAWNSGTHTNNLYAQQIMDPLVKQYNVDVVYTGHSHNYTRCGILSTQSTPDSIVPNVAYVTEGDSGAPNDSVDLTNATTGSSQGWRHIVLADSTYSYITFDVEGKTLTMKAWSVIQANGSPVVGVTNTSTVPSYSSVTATTSTPIETLVLNHFTDVSSQVSAATSNIVYSRATKTYNGSMTITNNGTAALTGNIHVALNGLVSGVSATGIIAQNNGLTPGIALLNATGQNNGAPMITVSTSGLAAGASVTVPLQFSNPSGSQITFAPVTLQE